MDKDVPTQYEDTTRRHTNQNYRQCQEKLTTHCSNKEELHCDLNLCNSTRNNLNFSFEN